MSTFGDDLLQSLQEALAHARGEQDDLVEHRVETDALDPKVMRSRLKLTQDQMTFLMGMSVSGYRKWQQGQQSPGGAARTLLRVMEREPEAVKRALVTNFATSN